MSSSTRPVLIVEGAGLAGLAQVVLTDYDCFGWDEVPALEQLIDRNVELWAKSAEIARKLAGAIVKVAASVTVIDSHDDDLGQVLRERMTGEALHDYMSNPARRKTIKKPGTTVRQRGAKTDAPAGGVVERARSAYAMWEQLALQKDGKDHPEPSLGNVTNILQRHPALCGRIWSDQFRGRMYARLFDGPVVEWHDNLERQLTVWIQQQMLMPKVVISTVRDAVLLSASLNVKNSFVDWIKTLAWDGIERLPHWVVDYLGAAGTEHHVAAGMNFFISMVARGLCPGIKADHMIVLEGVSGANKTTALKVIGGEWYAAVSTKFGSKPFLEAVQGRLLVEIPDMAGMDKAQHDDIIATLTTDFDAYRVPWEKYASDHPRTTVFAATSETNAYLRYPAGKRRYWPIECGDEINVDALKGARDQLFAEARVRYERGEKWYVMPESTKAEQTHRIVEDTWSTAMLDYAHANAKMGMPVTSAGLLISVGVELKDQHDGLFRRVAKIMVSDTWRQVISKDNQGRSYKEWRFRML